MESTMGIKSSYAPVTLGMKQSRSPHTMGIKTHMVLRHNRYNHIGEGNVDNNENLGQFEPLGIKTVKPGSKTSYLEKKPR